MIETVIILIWTIYMLIEGAREAFYWRQNSQVNRKMPNIHWLFLIQRIIVFVQLIWIKPLIVLTLILILISPFIHNGMYYWTRNWIDKDIYQKGWFDQSTTSTAWSTKLLKPIVRTIGFIIGLVLFYFVIA